MSGSLIGQHYTPLEFYLDAHHDCSFDILYEYLRPEDRENLDCGEIYSYFQDLRNYSISCLDLTLVDGKIHENVKIHPYFQFFYQERDNKVVWMFPTVQDVFRYAREHFKQHRQLVRYLNNFGDQNPIISQLATLYWMFRDNDSMAELLYLHLHDNQIPEGINPIDEFQLKKPYELFDKLSEISLRDLHSFIKRRMEYLYDYYPIDRLDALDKSIHTITQTIPSLKKYLNNHPNSDKKMITAMSDFLDICEENVESFTERRVATELEVDMELSKLYGEKNTDQQ